MIAFKFVQLKHKQLIDGTSPIFLRLTKNRVVKYLSTKASCEPKYWNEPKQKIRKGSPCQNELDFKIETFKQKITNYFDVLPLEQREKMTLEECVSLLTLERKVIKSGDFFALLENKINQLKEDGKMSTALYNQDAFNSVRNFTNKAQLNLKSINYQWLKDFERFLKKTCKESSISVRMRVIRTIYNDAIKMGIVTPNDYPFKEYQISKLKATNNSRAISVSDFSKIINLDTITHPDLHFSKNLFLFSYYTGGMNFIDMMMLKKSNIYDNGNRLKYVRSKTGGLFDFKLTEPAKNILNYYLEQPINTDYVFPILLKNNLTPQQIENRKHKIITKFNRDLKEIGRICQFEFDLTSYVARHSFATHLKEKNVPTDVISETLGHQNIRITQTYLKRFENAVIDNAMETLVN